MGNLEKKPFRSCKFERCKVVALGFKTRDLCLITSHWNKPSLVAFLAIDPSNSDTRNTLFASNAR